MKITVRTYAENPPPSWDILVSQHGGTVFHSLAWGRYVAAAQSGATPIFVDFSDSGRSVGCWLLFREASRGLIGRFLTQHTWSDAMPALTDSTSDSVAMAIRAFEDDCRAAGDVHLSIGSFADTGTSEALARLGYHTRQRLEFPISLSSPEDELFESISYTRRKNIRKAERQGVEVRPLAQSDGPKALRRLQAASFERILARGGSIGQQTVGEDDPVAILISAGVGRIVGAFHQEQLVSVSFFTTFNGVAYHTLSGHSQTGLQVQAPTLLLWYMMRQFKIEGYHTLNLGGCSRAAEDPASPEHGVYAYKRTFQHRMVECWSGERALCPMRWELLRLAKRIRRSLVVE